MNQTYTFLFLSDQEMLEDTFWLLQNFSYYVRHEMKSGTHCLESSVLGSGLVSRGNLVAIGVRCASPTAVLFQGSQPFY